jgi:hypothetical protein
MDRRFCSTGSTTNGNGGSTWWCVVDGIGFRSDSDEGRNCVPGEDIESVFDGTAQDVADQLVSGSPDGRDSEFLILGCPSATRR